MSPGYRIAHARAPMQCQLRIVFAGHATDVVKLIPLTVAVAIVGTAPGEQVQTTNGADGNAVPPKVIVPVTAVPPVPTLTLPANAVDPVSTAGVVPKFAPTVGRASNFRRTPIPSLLVWRLARPSAVGHAIL